MIIQKVGIAAQPRQLTITYSTSWSALAGRGSLTTAKERSLATVPLDVQLPASLGVQS